jgi:hypothetical protein
MVEATQVLSWIAQVSGRCARGGGGMVYGSGRVGLGEIRVQKTVRVRLSFAHINEKKKKKKRKEKQIKRPLESTKLKILFLFFLKNQKYCKTPG